jgi:subtilisin family serine protease
MRCAGLAAAVAAALVAPVAGAATAPATGPAAVATKKVQRAHARRKPVATGPNDPLWPQEWGPRAVGVQALWQAAPARPVVVAVVDTGVDPQQADLAGALVPGWNAIDGTSNAADDNGHGTAVAGIVAARAGNRVGIAGYCPTCSIMPVKVLDASGHGSAATIAAGVDWAVQHGANVINLSLVLQRRDAAVSAAVARAVAAGIVVVAASGNDGGSAPEYPAAEPGVVSVSGDDPSGALFPWSNAGSWVKAWAPGCNLAPAPDGTFGQFCGTSSAAAAMSGIVGAALALPGATAARVEADVSQRVDARALAASLASG